MFNKTIAWWYWLVTVCLLATGLAGVVEGFYFAILFCAWQVVFFYRRESSLSAFPVQVRLAYLGLLLLAQWPLLYMIYWVQLIGTCAMVLVGYCLLARSLALMPWNRSQPLTWTLLTSTLFSPPVTGSVQIKD